MPTSKNRRKKRHTPKPCRAHPMFAEKLYGAEIEAEDLDKIDAVADAALDLVRLRTRDQIHYDSVHAVLRNIFIAASILEDKERLQDLAVFGRAMLDVIHKDATRPDGERLLEETDMKTLVEPLATAIKTARAIHETFTRSELVFMERAGGTYEVKVREAVGVYLFRVVPDEDEIKATKGLEGIAFLHGRTERGSVKVVDGVAFWATEDERLIRLNRPTVVMVKKEKA